MNGNTVEDIEMAEMDVKISETTHGTIDYSSYLNNNKNNHLNVTPNNFNNNYNNNNWSGSFDSADSGYLSCTSSTARKSISRSREVKKYWLRSEHRKSLKFNSLMNGSEDSGFEEPSLDGNGSISMDRNQFRADLKSHRLRNRNRIQLGAVTPATAVSKTQITPLSPCTATTSTYMACEPVQEDVEKIRAVPQSTPYICSEGKLIEPFIPRTPVKLTFSPKTSKPPAITSVENKKFSKLKISNLSKITKPVEPRRLNFSKRTCTNCKVGGRPDYTGRETVDILSLLGDKSNHWRAIGKILSYLSPQDLCAISMVSQVWRKICFSDTAANLRRLNQVYVRQNTKENLVVIKNKSDITSSPKSTSRLVKRNYLTDVQNVQATPGRRAPPQSPPVSPSKVKFHSFVKASRALAPTERLCRCPKCSFASHVDAARNVGVCTREGCRAEFCPDCVSTPHSGPCKTPLLATPTKRKKAPLIVGSKQSKRNLRRL
ncbi:F-box only protein 43-like isoform X1 [Cotesia glomerata]|uniref:F-box only protein 43-like isoform X1 n=1 Tax=Cotesia glomerata TaxID=32391 RepID=UPI001D0118C1|nr:F-box only protein 43-like isoform X1 [Cotesia glomerata]